jgi:hypothetical protein
MNKITQYFAKLLILIAEVTQVERAYANKIPYISLYIIALLPDTAQLVLSGNSTELLIC